MMRLALSSVALVSASLAAAATVSPVPRTVARASPNEGTSVKLQVIRHGYSCQNLITDCGGICIVAAAVLSDPILTDYGLNETKAAAVSYVQNNNTQPDVVMSSSLLRAMETALFTFPNATTVYQVPYVKEYFVLAGEQPVSVAAQDEILRQFDGNDTAARMNYTYVTGGDDDQGDACGVLDSSPRCKADWDQFLKWLASTLVNNPPVEIAGKLQNGNESVTIALATHSLLMEREIIIEGQVAPGVTPGQVLNNQGFEANFVLRRDAEVPSLAMADGSLWAPIAGLSGVSELCGDNGKGVVDADYGRCRDKDSTVFEAVSICL